MSFIKQSSILIRNSLNDLYTVSVENGISINYVNSNFEIKKNKKILSDISSLSTIYFDIASNNDIYGLFTEKNKFLNYLHINSSTIYKTLILKYDTNKYKIKFPFIKHLDDKVHIIYYEINKKKSHFSTLVHYYKKNNIWVKSNIDFLNYTLLNNFEVIINESNLKIYYFKLIDRYEELFVATYSFDKEKWDTPIQITFSKKTKVYLSVLIDSKNIYHIVYSEKNQNQFYCKYINLFFENKIPHIQSNIFLSTKIPSLFPNLIKYNDILYCQWMEYNHLYSTCSLNNGESWTDIKLFNEIYNYSFTQFIFKSNANKDELLNAPKFYSYTNSLKLLGTKIDINQ